MAIMMLIDGDEETVLLLVLLVMLVLESPSGCTVMMTMVMTMAEVMVATGMESVNVT